MRTSEKTPSETVWKIAEGVLDRLCSVAQDGELRLLHPLSPLGDVKPGAFPIFQTVSPGASPNEGEDTLGFPQELEEKQWQHLERVTDPQNCQERERAKHAENHAGIAGQVLGME
jgi:hypothetical protein